jgi:Mg2+ and Co2+ transporter CorA
LQSDKCINEHLTTQAQLSYTRELHQILPLWAQVRRRLVAAKDLAEQMVEHPFFRSINGLDDTHVVRSLLSKRLKILDDQIGRCNELAEQTNVLISLIFNIATLQDTKAAVEESKAANTLASSIRRVTMLTFIYLPLTLASVRQLRIEVPIQTDYQIQSIFGMNITHITGDNADSPLWAYFVLAVSLMIATFGGWYVWSRTLSRMERRAVSALMQKV